MRWEGLIFGMILAPIAYWLTVRFPNHPVFVGVFCFFVAFLFVTVMTIADYSIQKRKRKWS